MPDAHMHALELHEYVDFWNYLACRIRVEFVSKWIAPGLLAVVDAGRSKSGFLRDALDSDGLRRAVQRLWTRGGDGCTDTVRYCR